MAEHVLEAHMGTSVTIDICATCQAFWFDGRESLRLAPASTLKLFRIIGEQAATARQPMAERCTCPRCGLVLIPTQDLQRKTRFQYRRCAKQHGRFITFFDFLREKNFITPMSAAQIDELRAHVQSVNCSNCGAPVDLAKSSSCGHCGSPLSMLDMKQAEAVVAQLRDADRSSQGIDPALVLSRERARREVQHAFAQFEQGESWFTDIARTGTVAVGLRALAQWLGRL